MSRSYRHLPIIGMTTACSEKEDKRLANRAFRRANALKIDNPHGIYPALREYSDPWGWSKDGKMWFEPEKYPKSMRK